MDSRRMMLARLIHACLLAVIPARRQAGRPQGHSEHGSVRTAVCVSDRAQP